LSKALPRCPAVTQAPQPPPSHPKRIPQFRWGMESMFWLLGPPAGTGGPPQHRTGQQEPSQQNGKYTQVGSFALLL
jgi:hypothetical protein